MRFDEISRIPQADHSDRKVADDLKWVRQLQPKPTGHEIDGFAVRRSEDRANLFVSLWGKVNPIAYVRLQPNTVAGIRGYHATEMGVLSNFRGQNLALKLYQYLLDVEKLTLFSGYMQTEGGTAVWKKLVTSGRYDCFVIDGKNVTPLDDPQQAFRGHDVLLMARPR